MPRFGMITFATEYSMQPAEVAHAIEQQELDAIYVSEHPHSDHQEIQVSRRHRLSQGLLLRLRSDCGADGGGERNQPNQAWHLYHPARAARSERRLEPGRDG